MEFDPHLVCCLCNHQADTEAGLEAHIDSSHSDIFRSSDTDEIQVEPGQDPSLQTCFTNEDPAQLNSQMFQPSMSQVSGVPLNTISSSNAVEFQLQPGQDRSLQTYFSDEDPAQFNSQVFQPGASYVSAPILDSFESSNPVEFQVEPGRDLSLQTSFKSEDPAEFNGQVFHPGMSHVSAESVEFQVQPGHGPFITNNEQFNSNMYHPSMSRVTPSTLTTTLSSNSVGFHPSMSQVSANADDEEVNKITETYKMFLNSQPSLKCPHCNFFTVNVQVLQSHLEKKHAREERINPTSKEYFESKTQINQTMIQPSSLRPYKARTNNSSERRNRLSLPSSVNHVERKQQIRKGRTSFPQNANPLTPQMDQPINPTSQEYFKSTTQINKNMIHSTSLNPNKPRTNNSSVNQNTLSYPSSVNHVERKQQTRQGKTYYNPLAVKVTQMDKSINPAQSAFHQMDQPYNPAQSILHPMKQSINLTAFQQIDQTYNPGKSNLNPMNHSINPPVQTPVSLPILVPQSGSGGAGQSEAFQYEQIPKNFVSVKSKNKERKSKGYVNLKTVGNNTKKVVSTGNKNKLKEEQTVNKTLITNQIVNKSLITNQIVNKNKEDQTINKTLKTNLSSIEEMKRNKEGKKNKQNLVKVEIKNDKNHLKTQENNKSAFTEKNCQKAEPKTQENNNNKSAFIDISNKFQNKKRKSDQTIDNYHQSALGKFSVRIIF